MQVEAAEEEAIQHTSQISQRSVILDPIQAVTKNRPLLV